MRLLVALAFVCAAPAALAELYRWVDPQTGSVKYSSYPPPWHGDPARERTAPKVEVLAPRFALPPKPAAAPEKPAAAPVSPEARSELLTDLESRWRDMLEDLGTFTQRADFERAGAGLRQQVEAYDAMRVELDKLDPQGAARRRKEEGSAVDQVKRGLVEWLRK